MKVLAVYIEPAPYIVRLVELLRSEVELDVVYLSQAATQNWEINIYDSFKQNHNGNNGLGVRELYRKVKSGNYDIIHLAGWGGKVFLLLLLYSRFSAVRVTVETDTPLSTVSPLKKILKQIFFPFLFRIPSFFFPAGSRQADYLRYYGVPDKKIKVAQMTVDVDYIKCVASKMTDRDKLEARDSIGIPQDRVLFLYVGRLEPHKGLQDLLDAFSRYTYSQRNKKAAALLIVGDGVMRDEIQSAADVSEDIFYFGRKSGDELWCSYAIADAFVLPSRFEPWGLVVNEAMAAHLPVIVSDRVGCIDDLVRNDDTGLIFEAENVSALVDAMVEISNDESRRKEIACNAHNLIQRWTLEDESRIIADTWRRLMKA